MKSDIKAEKYYKEGKVFPLKNTAQQEFWAVEGGTGVHNVRFDKQKDEWFCDCKNIRNSFCSHIKTILLYKDDNNGKEI